VDSHSRRRTTPESGVSVHVSVNVLSSSMSSWDENGVTPRITEASVRSQSQIEEGKPHLHKVVPIRNPSCFLLVRLLMLWQLLLLDSSAIKLDSDTARRKNLATRWDNHGGCIIILFLAPLPPVQPKHSTRLEAFVLCSSNCDFPVWVGISTDLPSRSHP